MRAFSKKLSKYLLALKFCGGLLLGALLLRLLFVSCGLHPVMKPVEFMIALPVLVSMFGAVIIFDKGSASKAPM